MKNLKNINLWLVVMMVSLLSSCTGIPDDKQFERTIVIKDDATISEVQHVFEQYSFPNGIVPALVVEDSVPDLLKIGARADELFDEISEQREEDDFENYGLMIYVTHNPKLIQLRMGSYYELYGNLKGATMGLPYFDLQRSYIEGNPDSVIRKMLDMACQVSVERQRMTWRQKAQLSNVQIAINDVMEWFGSPSSNLYGKVVLRPIYTIISYGSKTFGSWMWGVGLVFLLIILIRYGINYFFNRIVPIPLLSKLFGVSFSLFFSMSSAGCAILFSNGRLEDLIAIKAFGIPYVDNFIIDSSFFVHDNSIWMASAFVLIMTLSLALTNNFFISSFLPNDIQRSKWDSLSDTTKSFITGSLQMDDIPTTDPTPYLTLATQSMTSQIGVIMGLATGALFFFPKAIIWVGIAFAIAKILSKLGNYVEVMTVRRRYSYKESPHMTGMLVSSLGITVLTCAVVMALSWWLNPFDTDESVKEAPISVIKNVEVKAKVANLRVGPGTEFDYMRIEGMSEKEHLQVSRGQKLGVIEESGNWYKVLVDEQNNVAYINKRLCKDLSESNRKNNVGEPIKPSSQVSVQPESGKNITERGEITPPQTGMSDGGKIYDYVDQMPSFPGRAAALNSFLSDNINYPAIAVEEGIQGTVVVSFIVEKSGVISNVCVVRSVDPALDREAVRVVKAMPHWNPGRQNGENVRVKYTIPISFKL